MGNYITKNINWTINKTIFKYSNCRKVAVIVIILLYGMFLIPSYSTQSLDGYNEQSQYSKSSYPIINNNLTNQKNKTNNIKTSEPWDGYTLYNLGGSKKTYLIDLNGKVIHTWECEYTSDLSVYLLEDGNLIRPCYLGIHPLFLSGGMAGCVQKVDWDGSVIWDFRYSNSTHLSHHDIEILPNGNILMIAFEYKSYSEAKAAGRKPYTIPPVGGLWPDHIIEVKPTGPTSGDIIWEWHVWDHLIQDYDSKKDNFGVVEDHPELIDINFITETSTVYTMNDITHINSIDYNEDLDQILLSVNCYNEIWIIDHSTTTAEAAGHTGGNSGKGGDLLYRWGNPQTYKAYHNNGQKLFHQHDAQWIDSGLPGSGNILIFNNGVGRPGFDYLSVDEIVPPVDGDGNYYYNPGFAYGPDNPCWIYTDLNLISYYSSKMGSAQRLPNGNTLICNSYLNGKGKQFFEVDPSGATIWTYNYPDNGLLTVFKIVRYSTDYFGLKNLHGPRVKITYPKDNEVVSGQVNILGNANDPDGDETIQYVKIKIDNGSWNIADGTINWHYNFHTELIDDGEHTISAISNDGNINSYIDEIKVYVSNNEFKVNASDVYYGVINEPIQFYGSILCGGKPPFVWFWQFGDGNISNFQNPEHIYTNEGVYYANLCVTDNLGKNGEDNATVIITKEYDKNPPNTMITKPINRFYINNKSIIPFFATIIIGDILIEVETSDNESYIKQVEFYIDDTFKESDSIEPYSYYWSEKSSGKHTIKIVSYDNAGNSNSVKLTVWKLF
jgi:PKD repeat protein